MNIGVNVGYSHAKFVAEKRRALFASVVGTPEVARFSVMGGSNGSIMLAEPDRVQVGAGAVSQSRFLRRREDRGWIHSEEWYTLFLAGYSQVAAAPFDPAVRVVTGLPVAFYDDGRELRDRLLGRHRVQLDGAGAQSFEVTDCRVIPEPFGTLLAVCLDDRGTIVDKELAMGAVGVIDVGGKTTNLLSVNRLAEIGRETASVSVGAWDAVRGVRAWLGVHCPNRDYRDHEVMEAIIAGETRYYGERVDLSEPVREVLEPLAEQVVAEASQLWNGAAALDAILVGGGGALLVGNQIRLHFRHARIVDDPVFANALGFWRFGQRQGRS